jgi:hypothetical protein
MKRIDAEIFEVEQRLAMRKVALGHQASTTRKRAAKALISPLTLVGAVAVGFLVAGLARRKRHEEPVVAQDTKEQSKGFALGTLLMTGATWFIRSQFGGPVGLAQFVLSKVHGSRPPATAVPAEFPPRVPR